MPSSSMRSIALFYLVAAGCPAAQNPEMLWLGPDGSQAVVKLVDREPEPF